MWSTITIDGVTVHSKRQEFNVNVLPYYVTTDFCDITIKYQFFKADCPNQLSKFNKSLNATKRRTRAC